MASWFVRAIRGHCVVFWGKTLYSLVASVRPDVALRWTSITSRWEWKYYKSPHATETGISSGLMSHFARMQ